MTRVDEGVGDCEVEDVDFAAGDDDYSDDDEEDYDEGDDGDDLVIGTRLTWLSQL